MSAAGDSEDRSQSSLMSGNGSISNSQKGKPSGILTGLFTGNPALLMKGKVSWFNGLNAIVVPVVERQTDTNDRTL